MTEENKPVEPPADEDAAGLARRLRKLADMNRDELGAKLDRSTAALIERQQAEVERLTTERDAARSTLETLAVQPPELWQAHARATAAEAEVADLKARLATAGEALEPFLPAYQAYVGTIQGWSVPGETSTERRFSKGEREDRAMERAVDEMAAVTFDQLAAVADALASIKEDRT